MKSGERLIGKKNILDTEPEIQYSACHTNPIKLVIIDRSLHRVVIPVKTQRIPGRYTGSIFAKGRNERTGA